MSYYKLSYRTEFQGLPISIENRKGQYRHWYDPNADEKGKTKMLYPYGYIRGTMGKDGDEVDVFIGPNKSSNKVYVVTQLKRFEFKAIDEQKVMLGFDNAIEAKTAYLQHYNDARFFGNMTEMSMEEFKSKVFKTKGRLLKSILKNIKESAKMTENMFYLELEKSKKEFKPVSPKAGSEVGSKTTFTVKSDKLDNMEDNEISNSFARAQDLVKKACSSLELKDMDLKKTSEEEKNEDTSDVKKSQISVDMLKALRAAAALGLSRRQRLDAAYKVGLAAGRNTQGISIEPAVLTNTKLNVGVDKTRPLYEPPIVPARQVETPNPLSEPKECNDHVYKSPEASPQEAVEFWRR